MYLFPHFQGYLNLDAGSKDVLKQMSKYSVVLHHVNV